MAALASSSLLWSSERAEASGGFFYGQQPVAQTAERILFEVGQDSVTMTAQISYSGSAQDFAWILPLSAVPDVNSLAVFPQKALNVLDSYSAPTFTAPTAPECYFQARYPEAAGAVAYGAADSSALPSVSIYVRTEVGPYDAAVVGSPSATQLVNWLRGAGYRITPVMLPYVTRYTEEVANFSP